MLEIRGVAFDLSKFYPVFKDNGRAPAALRASHWSNSERALWMWRNGAILPRTPPDRA